MRLALKPKARPKSGNVSVVANTGAIGAQIVGPSKRRMPEKNLPTERSYLPPITRRFSKEASPEARPSCAPNTDNQAGAAAQGEIDATGQLEYAGKGYSNGCFENPNLEGPSQTVEKGGNPTEETT